jgi:hypothetical protein
MQAFTILVIVFAFTALATLSLLAKNEGIRGMGRVFDGLARIAFAAFVFDFASATHPVSPWLIALASGLLVCGIVTILAGARKFARRKLVS